MRKIYTVFSILMFFIFTSACIAVTPNEIFANTTYIIGNEHFSRSVPLLNGKYEEPHLYVYYEDKLVRGDFNNDGLEDAAVIIAESGGGSGYYRLLAFLINDGTQFVHRASSYLGDRAIINSLKEQSGKVIVDMFIHDKNDCMARPTKRVKNVYGYFGKYSRDTILNK